MSLHSRRILLGVSGSIAAYKAADLCSRLDQLGADVHVVLTSHAAEFVGVATFRALTRNPVLVDLFEEPHARRIAHIDLAQSADLVLVAPATANVLAKLAHGIADDLLTTCLLAVPATTPLLVAPAMNTHMWQHPATIANVQLLQQRGVVVIPPASGRLACLDVGAGRLAAVEDILAAVQERLAPAPDFAGRRVLITAGATREPLDPVRFLSNRSSGKMGVALAEAAARRGAEVTLVAGFMTVAPPVQVRTVHVETAQEMMEACATHFPQCDLLIAAAAVADYAPEQVAPHKLKKSDSDETITLRLRRTPDILATLAAQKRPGQVVVGFAAETQDLFASAVRKLHAKHLDLIVANDVLADGAGFNADTNIVTLFWPDGRHKSLPQLPKREVADRILDAVREIRAGEAA
ncbi:MAG: bifunctional phosphopantothenoylcysteine decarboxylase/phosphopantothenate--cysteine ligase CoaBC [Chloroherpetonaceae bacterium]|nr:bifunctional phosphopantothenoylcysteine decarboxylase/phosphopantothenate--cysteine ligase CoaBC [Chthonomonadaceae bacterium]MDW8207086.1 bifunctional phosphopantothenoylcysteine decarboxylase/phosphopantothenate--cysteine ligase CoaBC [Chloroherpetonaceae bacterium]